MRALMSAMRGARKIGLLAVAVVLATLALTQDRPASAYHTEILPSRSGTSIQSLASLVLVAGGQPGGISPCDPSETDPTTACVYIWAKNVDNSTGASAFQVTFTYDSRLVHVLSAARSAEWLGSTGRSVSCPAPIMEEDPETGYGRAAVACVTFLPPPPYGPSCSNNHCNGLLATLSLESGSTIGTTTLDFSNDTYLLDTPPNPDDAARIPATVRSLNVVTAPCADFDGDGQVLISDILYAVRQYYTPDPAADLNGDGMVRVDDILIAVAEYYQYCSR